MNKKLTKEALQGKIEQLKEKKEIILNIDEDTYVIECDVKFRNSKTARLLDDLVKFFQVAYEKDELFDVATPYTTLLILKHFTTLDVSDDVEEAIDFLEVLIDLDILNTILEQLPQEELDNVFEVVAKAVNNFRDEIIKLEEEQKLDDVVEEDLEDSE